MARSNSTRQQQTTAIANASAGRNLPTDWKERLAARAKTAVEQVSSIQTGSFIGTKAGQLTWNGTPFANNQFEAVALDSCLENAYYPDKFDAENPSPPLCYAFGKDAKTMRPHEKSTQPQSATCKDCKHNEWETAEQGRGKACKNIARIALVSAKPLSQEGILKGEIAHLKIPVTSVKAWANYVRSVAAIEGIGHEGVITQITARPDAKTQFKIGFENVGRLPDAMMPAAVSRAEEASENIMFPYPESEPNSAPKGRGGRSEQRKRKY